MNDYEDLIRALLSNERRYNQGDRKDAATAIKELVDDYKGQGEALIHEVNAKLDAQVRAEKAEADLAAAREALLTLAMYLEDGGYAAGLLRLHAPAIAAARAEGGE